MAEINSGFKTQDINGRTRESKDVAFADDLISVTGSLRELQEKADVISGWCIVTGIKIAISKLRTFGRQWGTRKEGNETGTIIIQEGGGISTEVEVKNEGIMTHLGVIWDMDLNGDRQWTAIKATIERLGEIICKSSSRKRDKILVINSCLKYNVLYRLQFCTWNLARFEELDKSLNRLIRGVTNNMRNFLAKS